jgi:hypothetical protein
MPKTMKAAVVKALGKALAIEEVRAPSLEQTRSRSRSRPAASAIPTCMRPWATGQ